MTTSIQNESAIKYRYSVNSEKPVHVV